MRSDIHIFDRDILFQRRQRHGHKFTHSSFLHKEVFTRLLDQLEDFTKTFNTCLEINPRFPGLADHPKVAHYISASTSSDQGHIQIDEEALPFDNHAVDLIFSNLNLHLINDVPGTLAQMHRILKPDGLLLASQFGGETLHELRHSLMQAELEVMGGASPRVAPFANVRDMGMLLQRAGYTLPVVNADPITVTYANIFTLMEDLRFMGETNVVANRYKRFSPRALFTRAGEIYQKTFGQKDGRIPATFEIITIVGWAPHENQQQPLKRGSATTRLAEAL